MFIEKTETLSILDSEPKLRMDLQLKSGLDKMTGKTFVQSLADLMTDKHLRSFRKGFAFTFAVAREFTVKYEDGHEMTYYLTGLEMDYLGHYLINSRMNSHQLYTKYTRADEYPSKIIDTHMQNSEAYNAFVDNKMELSLQAEYGNYGMMLFLRQALVPSTNHVVVYNVDNEKYAAKHKLESYTIFEDNKGYINGLVDKLILHMNDINRSKPLAPGRIFFRRALQENTKALDISVTRPDARNSGYSFCTDSYYIINFTQTQLDKLRRLEAKHDVGAEEANTYIRDLAFKRNGVK